MMNLFPLSRPFRPLSARRDALVRRLIRVEAMLDPEDADATTDSREWYARASRVEGKINAALRRAENQLMGRDPETPEPERPRQLFAYVRPALTAVDFQGTPKREARVMPEFITCDLMAWLEEGKGKRRTFATMGEGRWAYQLGMWRGKLCEFSTIGDNKPSRSVCSPGIEDASVNYFMHYFTRRWKASAEIHFDPSTIKPTSPQ